MFEMFVLKKRKKELLNIYDAMERKIFFIGYGNNKKKISESRINW